MLEINELLDSKTYVNNGITFPKVTDLVTPFLRIFGDSTFKVETDNAIVNQDPDTLAMNTAYPRVKIEHRAESSITGFTSVVGLLYGLDIGKPVIKVYTGQEVNACTNLCIFHSEHSSSYDLMSGGDIKAYNKAEKYFRDKVIEMEEYEGIYQQLQRQIENENEFNEILGDALKRSIKKNLVSTITKGVKSMITPNSKYHIYPSGEFNCTMWNMYNSFTETLNTAELLERPIKTLELYKLLV